MLLCNSKLNINGHKKKNQQCMLLDGDLLQVVTLVFVEVSVELT